MHCCSRGHIEVPGVIAPPPDFSPFSDQEGHCPGLLLSSGGLLILWLVVGTNFQAAGGSRGKRRWTGWGGAGGQLGRRRPLKRLLHLQVSLVCESKLRRLLPAHSVAVPWSCLSPLELWQILLSEITTKSPKQVGDGIG